MRLELDMKLKLKRFGVVTVDYHYPTIILNLKLNAAPQPDSDQTPKAK